MISTQDKFSHSCIFQTEIETCFDGEIWLLAKYVNKKLHVNILYF